MNTNDREGVKFRLFTFKEKQWYAIWLICKIIVKPFMYFGNRAIDKLNKSYYKNVSP